MKRLILILLLSPLLTQAQTITLPFWVVDSMLFEVRYSRQCRLTVDTLQNEIQKLGSELIATGTALKLSQKESKINSDLVLNAKESNEILTKQFQKDADMLRKKIRTRNKVIIGMVVLFLAKESLN